MSNEVTVLIPMHAIKTNKRWLDEAVGSFPDGTTIELLRNLGDVSGSLNHGLKNARTEFVLPFGADDVAAPDMLERLLGPAWNADVVYPTMMIVDEQLRLIGTHPADPYCPLRLQENNYISGASLIRRETAIAAGGFRKMEVLEDWDLWLRMQRAGARFKPCSDAVMLYRQHHGSRNDKLSGHDELLAEKRRELVLEHTGNADPLENAQATFYNAATPATTYLRCQLPARLLPAVVKPHVTVRMNEETYEMPEQHGPAAVLQLVADKERALMALMLREKGIRVLLESDDNYTLNPGRDILKRSQWQMKIGQAHNTREGHLWVASQVDGVITTTPYLADRYRKYNPNVYVCRNSIDPVDWPEPVKPDDGTLRIIWTASLSHTDDIPLVTRAFEWASRQPGVEVYVTGLNPEWRFKYGYLPWLADLDAYRHHFFHFDIGVAPIRATPFSLGRSDVKALEYAMGSCAPILSDVAPYSDWTDGENCMKASNAGGFLRAIQHLVSNRDEVKQLAAAARDYTLSERTIASEIHTWREALNG